MSALRDSGRASCFIDVAIGIYRHDPVMCSAGFYRVVTGMGTWGFHHFDAVTDDFGNLVKVGE